MNPTITSEPALLSLEELAGRFVAVARSLWPNASPVVQFEPARRPEFGDLSTNFAFSLAKIAREKPQQIAEKVISIILKDDAVAATVAEATPLAGFINLRLRPPFWQRVVTDVIRDGERYGRETGNGDKISLEFGSANPTGPLVVVQGRTLSIGDTLARAMRHVGYDVFTEWIINDAGTQLIALGRSVYARYQELFGRSFDIPEDGYRGDYLVPIAEKLRDRDGNKWVHVSEPEAIAYFARFACDIIIAEQQDVARRFGVEFDHWQSEQVLHDNGAIERGIQRLRDLGMLKERDGAVWLRTSEGGESEERVVIRSDGRPTYFANDIAYHYQKLQRADHIIDILGPDHHGYIARLKALANAYGRPGAIEVLIAQQITLKRGDEIVSMSKRAGRVVTLQEVIDEVGVDAARFFFVMLSTDQPLTFDLELAKRQSNDNPVYYVQYGHARIAAIIRNAYAQQPEAIEAASIGANVKLLVEPEELAVAKKLFEFPDVVRSVAHTRSPHHLPRFAREVAASFHTFYEKHRVVSENRPLTSARLSLCIAAKDVLALTLSLCGISAPDSMQRDQSLGKAAPGFLGQPRSRVAYSDIGYAHGLLDEDVLVRTGSVIKFLASRVAAARTRDPATVPSGKLAAYNMILGLSVLAVAELRALLVLSSMGLERSARIHLRSIGEYLMKARVLTERGDLALRFVHAAGAETKHLGDLMALDPAIIEAAQQRYLGDLDLASESPREHSIMNEIRDVYATLTESDQFFAIEHNWLSQFSHGGILALHEVAMTTDGIAENFFRIANRDGAGEQHLLRGCHLALWLAGLMEGLFSIEDHGDFEAQVKALDALLLHYKDKKARSDRSVLSRLRDKGRPESVDTKLPK
jgi:arginyl-tRNA synthetase